MDPTMWKEELGEERTRGNMSAVREGCLQHELHHNNHITVQLHYENGIMWNDDDDDSDDWSQGNTFTIHNSIKLEKDM